MPRPLVTVEGRTKPVGDKKSGRTGTGGLTFTRIRGVRRLRAFSSAPRRTTDITTAEESFEERFQIWMSKYGGTRPEFVVWDWLKNKEKMREDVDFKFQSSQFRGRQALGGSVVDFELPFLRLMFRVQGERFHRVNTEVIASDILQKQALMSLRFTIVDLWAEDLAVAPNRVMEAALRGIELHAARE